MSKLRQKRKIDLSGIYISVDQREVGGGLQVSIGRAEKDGSGSGYRIAGPKYDGRGRELLRHKLTQRDRSEIEAYLREIT